MSIIPFFFGNNVYHFYERWNLVSPSRWILEEVCLYDRDTVQVGIGYL